MAGRASHHSPSFSPFLPHLRRGYITIYIINSCPYSRKSLAYPHLFSLVLTWDQISFNFKIANARFTATSERDTAIRRELVEIRALPAKSTKTAEELWPSKSVTDDLEPAAYHQLNDFTLDGRKSKNGPAPATPDYIRKKIEYHLIRRMQVGTACLIQLNKGYFKPINHKQCKVLQHLSDRDLVSLLEDKTTAHSQGLQTTTSCGGHSIDYNTAGGRP